MRLPAALAFGIFASSAQAAPLALECLGDVTTSIIPNDSVAPKPQKGFVSEHSLVVDLDRRVVFGFWFESRGISLLALPIIKADGNNVYFEADKEGRLVERHIIGRINRVTGAVYADDFVTFSNGDMQRRSWDLDCKPTHSLF